MDTKIEISLSAVESLKNEVKSLNHQLQRSEVELNRLRESSTIEQLRKDSIRMGIDVADIVFKKIFVQVGLSEEAEDTIFSYLTPVDYLSPNSFLEAFKNDKVTAELCVKLTPTVRNAFIRLGIKEEVLVKEEQTLTV